MIGEELINTVTKKVSIDESKNIIIPNTQNNNIHEPSNNTTISNNKIPNNKLIDNNQPQINNQPTNNHQELINNQPQINNSSTNNQPQINNSSINNQSQINNSSTNNQESTNHQESTNNTPINQQSSPQNKKNNYLRFIPNIHNIIFFIICILIFAALYKYITYTKHDIEAELIKFNELNKHFNN